MDAKPAMQLQFGQVLCQIARCPQLATALLVDDRNTPYGGFLVRRRLPGDRHEKVFHSRDTPSDFAHDLARNMQLPVAQCRPWKPMELERPPSSQ